MSTVVPVMPIGPDPVPASPVEPAPPADKKDKWDKAEVILKPLGGLLTAIEQGVYGALLPHAYERTLWVGARDFPMVDNTYLSPDEPYTVVIDDFDEDSVAVELICFPASFAKLREKSYLQQKVVQHLIDRREFFSSRASPIGSFEFLDTWVSYIDQGKVQCHITSEIWCSREAVSREWPM